MIPTLLSFAMVRELGPLITAIILAGRSGSAFAAELGTMKVTEEINALTTFGLDPSRFLVVPRILAAIIVTPLLSVFGTLFGLVGGYLIMLGLGYGLPFYVNQVRASVNWVDFLQGVFKAGVFAFLIAAIGCLKGLQTRSGPGAVGDSTTRAVVAGIVMIVVADGLLGVVFYYLGI
jgi:phospholipid/cholesterol/gamma-HCH transport system permease protein